jgi:hypothetical protein
MLHLEKIPSGVRSAFGRAVLDLSKRLGIHPDWLMAVFYRESRLNPASVNTYNAAGLIQITPTTAQDINATTAQILKAGYLDQLVYVERYYAMRIKQWGTPKSVYDLYLLTFYPPAMGKPDGHVLFRAGSTPYERNKALDNFLGVPKKGYISVRDIKSFVNQAIPKGYRVATNETPATPWVLVASAVLVAAGLLIGEKTNQNTNATYEQNA